MKLMMVYVCRLILVWTLKNFSKPSTSSIRPCKVTNVFHGSEECAFIVLIVEITGT